MNKTFALFSVLLLILSAAWVGLSAAPPGSVTQGQIPAPRPGFLAPDFELQDEQGIVTRLSDLRGRPVLVNFWASWCPPCRAEMPAMQVIHEEYGEQGFVILAVNTTHQDSEPAALQFLTERGATFPALFDRTGQAAARYEVRSLPTSFFIRADGTIAEVVVGGPMSEALLRSQAESLLAEGGR